MYIYIDYVNFILMYVNVCKQILHYLKSVHILSIIGFLLKTKKRRWAFFSENPNKKNPHGFQKKQTTNQQSKQLNKQKNSKTSPSRGSSSKVFENTEALFTYGLVTTWLLGPEARWFDQPASQRIAGPHRETVRKDNHLLQMNPFEVR